MNESEDEIRSKIYKDYTDELSKLGRSNSETYDKSLLTLSSAFLALTITFTKDVVPFVSANYKFLIYSSWILFALTIITTISSFIYAQFVMEELAKWAADYFLDGKQEIKERGSTLGKRILYLNALSGIVFIVAVVLITFFIILNVANGRT